MRVWFWLAGGAGGVKVGLPLITMAPVAPPAVPTPLNTHWVLEGQATCESEDIDPVGAVSAAGKLSIDHALPPPLSDPVRTSGPTDPPGPTTPADVDPVLPVPIAMQALEDAQAHLGEGIQRQVLGTYRASDVRRSAVDPGTGGGTRDHDSRRPGRPDRKAVRGSGTDELE